MSDNGSNAEKLSENGSNGSIEEILPEEIQLQNGDLELSTEASTPAVAVVAKPEVVNEPVAEVAQAEPSAAAQPAVDAPAVAEPAQAVEVIEEIPRPAQVEPPVQKQQKQEIVARLEDEEDEDDDDDIDETLTERLIGLTEMFPECVRNGSASLVMGSWAATKSAYGLSRSIAWIFFSSASILFMPVIIETERMSIMDQQKQQKTQMLLGPGVASSGAPSLGPPPI